MAEEKKHDVEIVSLNDGNNAVQLQCACGWFEELPVGASPWDAVCIAAEHLVPAKDLV